MFFFQHFNFVSPSFIASNIKFHQDIFFAFCIIPQEKNAECCLTIEHKIIFQQMLTNPSNEQKRQTKEIVLYY